MYTAIVVLHVVFGAAQWNGFVPKHLDTVYIVSLEAFESGTLLIRVKIMIQVLSDKW